MRGEPRRVTVWSDPERGWLFTVQGGNWHTLYQSPMGFATQAAAVSHVRKKYPRVEVRIEDAA